MINILRKVYERLFVDEVSRVICEKLRDGSLRVTDEYDRMDEIRAGTAITLVDDVGRVVEVYGLGTYLVYDRTGPYSHTKIVPKNKYLRKYVVRLVEQKQRQYKRELKAAADKKALEIITSKGKV